MPIIPQIFAALGVVMAVFAVHHLGRIANALEAAAGRLKTIETMATHGVYVREYPGSAFDPRVKP